MKMMTIACLLLVVIPGLAIDNFFTSVQADTPTSVTSDGCEIYCNDSPVYRDSNFSCMGVMNVDCNNTDSSSVLNSVTCLGMSSFVINSELEVSLSCDNYFTLNTIYEDLNCGGSYLFEYYVASKDDFAPIQDSNNMTCKGTFRQIPVADDQTTSTPTLTLQKFVGATPTPAPTPTPRKFVGDTARGLGAISDLLYADSNCTSVCGGKKYDGKVCLEGYEMSCHYPYQETVNYSCKGVFVGNLKNHTCIGELKLVASAPGVLATISCTESSFVDIDTNEIICEGEMQDREWYSTSGKSNVVA